MVDPIEQRVIEMITIRGGCYIFSKKKYDTYTPESSIHFDVQLDQDDVEELVEEFETEFGVDMSTFHLEAYYPEVKFSWNLFKKPDPVDVPDLTIDMFIQSAKAGKWLFD
ncbi:DUF1493 family protein [Raoultella planticola]|uniref:DUF1493 family protein n=1 Tax=Raoultella planticola TaxID=575 RepID=UPI0010AE49ED|nr:DUF1493 family protein [Raoultella planticola]MDU4422618.1 DUF1493 family protein [Raoultella sp.]TJZ59685.1 DUF1493 family protein [Raoultella planticola]